jgi:hypothetical protein
MRVHWGSSLSVVVVVIATSTSWSCPFCGPGRQTLTQEAAQAALIIYGTPTNPVFDPAATFQGTTDIEIEAVIKEHPFIAGKKRVTINRYLAIDKANPKKYLVFCDVFKDKLDPYLGMPVDPDSRIAEYLKGALAVREKDATTRLAYFFKYLDNPDINLSDDAFQEFANVDYKDFRPLAEKLDPDVIVKWLQDLNTPVSRFGLYGSMLGHCGQKRHAAILREMLDDPAKRFSTGIDGMLAGYVLLQPKEGWDYLRGILADGQRDFLLRYAGLRAARFFWEYRSDVVPGEEVIKALALMLPQDDIADLVIEDLRKWKRWELTENVLALFEKKTHDAPIIRRAILRFALQAPADRYPRAAAFVAAQRRRDAEWVKDVEELLQLEVMPPKPSNDAKTGAAPSDDGKQPN